MPGYKAVDVLLGHTVRGLICPHCELILRDAVQTEDGIRLCESCYLHLSKKRTGESTELTAPGCKVYKDRAVRRETGEVEVYCDHGCTWKGKAKDLQAHFKLECPNVPELCPNEGCQERLPVNQLTDHAEKYCQYRRVTCDWCHREITINLLNHHMCHCQEFASQHHQNSDVLIYHVEECGPPSQVSLPPTLRTDPVNANPLMEQGLLPSPPPNLRFELLFPIQEQHMMQGQPTSQLVTGIDHLRIHMHPENAAALRQRMLYQPGMQDNSRTRSQGTYMARIMALEMWVEELSRQLAALTRIAELQMQLQASLATTHNGSFLWRISEVSRRKQDAVDKPVTSISSPPFYTGHYGYKMCVRAYLNGDGTGHTTHLSLFMVLMKGNYDAFLKWPFKQRVSFTLLDQTHRNHIIQRFSPNPESSSFQRPSLDMNVASGFPRFVSSSIFTNKDYVRDDVMYIKCTVDTADIYQTY